ncbi:MAG: sulfate/molybdate ABC transporter ATP-binding protein [Ginsengibacter sp.]
MIHLYLEKTLTAEYGAMQMHINIDIEQGEFITIYGNSGAGKTSVLRMLAGLLQPDKGLITVNSKTWFDSNNKINVKPQQRKMGFVFQHYSLFPNMTIKENLLFALSKGQDKQIINELISIIELGDLQHRKPGKLSGGQMQRVALARALVRKPEILVLDEPLSALDTNMRMKLQDYILKLHRQFNLITILVSHDPGEVIKMSNKIFILENGRIIKEGKPIDVFTTKKVSGKFQFSGQVIQIEKQDVIYILTILIEGSLVKIVAAETEAKGINIGDKVLVASKAFNPVLQKIT